MEGQRVAIILVQNVLPDYLEKHSAEHPNLNTIIQNGNTTLLLRRGKYDYLTSLLALARVEEAKGTVMSQTSLEDLYYSVNIGGDYKNMYKGICPHILSNDNEMSSCVAEYHISHEILGLSGSLVEKVQQCMAQAENNLLILHLNGAKVVGDDPCKSVLSWAAEAINVLVPKYRIYMGLYPLAIPMASAIKPVHENPYIQSVAPVQTYCFYKSDSISDVVLTECLALVEYDRDNCRRDEIGTLAELASFKKRPGGLWMLAEQFMRQIAFRLGCISKFGA